MHSCSSDTVCVVVQLVCVATHNHKHRSDYSTACGCASGGRKVSTFEN